MFPVKAIRDCRMCGKLQIMLNRMDDVKLNLLEIGCALIFVRLHPTANHGNFQRKKKDFIQTHHLVIYRGKKSMRVSNHHSSLTGLWCAFHTDAELKMQKTTFKSGNCLHSSGGRRLFTLSLLSLRYCMFAHRPTKGILNLVRKKAANRMYACG